MTLRVLGVYVRLVVDADVPGIKAERDITFAYNPEPDDPLVKALLDKNQELLVANIMAKGPGEIGIG